MTLPIATLSDLYAYGAPASALSALTSGQQQSSLDASIELALGYFASRGNLPLVAWGLDLTQKVCHIAAYDMLSRIGFNPSDGADQNYKLRYDDALAWLLRISRGEVTPPTIIFSTPASVGSFPKVKSKPLRGW